MFSVVAIDSKDIRGLLADNVQQIPDTGNIEKKRN
jgi:hypothetical protein